MTRLLCMATIMVAAVATTPTAASAAPAPCTVKITNMRFHPTHVKPGARAFVKLVAHNCTNQILTGRLTWSGHFAGSNAGIPAGCPVIDPVLQPLGFSPHRNERQIIGFVVPQGCTATSLLATAQITANDGTLLAEQTATLTIV